MTATTETTIPPCPNCGATKWHYEVHEFARYSIEGIDTDCDPDEPGLVLRILDSEQKDEPELWCGACNVEAFPETLPTMAVAYYEKER